MFDATDMTRRDRAPEDNLIAHLPQDLQDRFYDARDDYYAECAKARRTKNIVVALMWVASTMPLMVALLTLVLVSHGHIAFTTLGAVIYGILGVVALAALTVPTLFGVESKVDRILYIWSTEVTDYDRERYERVAEEVNNYQRDVVGIGF